jgi:hypothetical protein
MACKLIQADKLYQLYHKMGKKPACQGLIVFLLIKKVSGHNHKRRHSNSNLAWIGFHVCGNVCLSKIETRDGRVYF